MFKPLLVVLFLSVLSFNSFGQLLQGDKASFTEQDTLRGSITPEREWWDLKYYHLSIEVLSESKSIIGTNKVEYTVLSPFQVMQIDLQQPMEITKVLQDDKELKFIRNGNAFFITLDKQQNVGEVNSIVIYYNGQPREAVNAPWDGGFTWNKDTNGNDFIATSCQGLGASVWWPVKDHMYDEPDSMMISVEVPNLLMDVSNGQLLKVEKNRKKKTKTYHWFVDNPINNYGVNVNIGDYAHFSNKYDGEKGELSLEYYVLKPNLEKAKKQFQQTKEMLEAFEHWFGPYPFYEDGFKLVEVPYLGMEHQSSVTYGNKFQNGYLGKDLSGTGWGLKFDFIIVHEAGHEWFANNITDKDIADMWIHESFTSYSECLFVEYFYGKEAGQEYVRGTRRSIQNDKPIIGIYGVNAEGSGDMYYKGSNMLNMIRQITNDDDKWLSTLRGLNKDFYHQTVETTQIENYLITHLGFDAEPIFDQYLRTSQVPILEYKIAKNRLSYRFTSAISTFKMPVDMVLGEKVERMDVTTEWKSVELKEDIQEIKVNPNYYIGIMKMQ
ncbi:M1 family metallopeptidase [Flammeovirga kamogawensis]|uniref:M1 family metallopeptidase n=1 Tax=Flammeovirga kamogawensis TaxID=373891 RepID=A0ABX8H1H0_9BACT|nr:M1 family metallopeptidase [Flammeovirga kamogawensis]MBB6463758.1 aminopeptidase N [Flammeovirga kamogawensis]QWG09730.1 M1 family metallopeptidase [Flammeovirga kamogawensis]TRX65243.1 M1 family metallopeptidase [Flammeovirga kamogawensis]